MTLPRPRQRSRRLRSLEQRRDFPSKGAGAVMCRTATSRTTLRIATFALVAVAGLLFGGATTAQARLLGAPATAVPSSVAPELPPPVSKETCVIDPNGECIVPHSSVSASP